MRHTPLHPLYDKKGRLIGRVCGHCRSIYTVAGNPSRGTLSLKDYHKNSRAHRARLKAARRQSAWRFINA